MKKNLKLIVLIILGVIGIVSMLTPIGRALEAESLLAKMKYSLYIYMFGGGTNVINTIGNVGPLTFAWCLSLFALIIIAILFVLYFFKKDLSRLTNIIVYSIISGLYLLAAILVWCILPITGFASSATLGVGTILTASVYSLGFVVSGLVLVKSLKK